MTAEGKITHFLRDTFILVDAAGETRSCNPFVRFARKFFDEATSPRSAAAAAGTDSRVYGCNKSVVNFRATKEPLFRMTGAGNMATVRAALL